MTDEPIDSGEPAERAIPRLLDLYGGRIYGLGLRLCGGPDEAQDLVQETFLNAFRHWDRFEGRSEPSTWLYTIAARACQRLHRKRSGEPEHLEPLEELLPQPGQAVPDLSVLEGPHEERVRREMQERLEAALARLPVEFRLPLVLKEIAELPLAEVARVLGLKEETVKTRLHRARLKLRKELDAALPRGPVPPPPASRQVCLDLLRAKQEAMDRGVPFIPQGEICARCQAVFGTLDLARDACQEIGRGNLPPAVRDLLLEDVRQEAARRRGLTSPSAGSARG
jgi:RNA polymerase sigma-70 factor (ECF subfamily)